MKKFNTLAALLLTATLLLVGCDSGATSEGSSNNQPQAAATPPASGNPADQPADDAAAIDSSTEVEASGSSGINLAPEAEPASVQRPVLRATRIAVPQRWSSFKPGSTVNLPTGFKISVFAAGLGRARMLTYAPNGDLFVSDSNGRVLVLPDRNRDGVADDMKVYASGLNQPHGLAFHKEYLYIAESDQVVRYRYASGDQTASGGPEVIISGIPEGGHNTRTIVFGPDNKLYLSVGSSCNVCEESNSLRAAITVYDEDGGNGRTFSKGLRNAVGLEFAPDSNNLWAVVNGRDGLGDNTPPEILVQAGNGQDFGWPYCYANRVYDRDFGRKDASYCQGVEPPDLQMQAHSAPLGLDFYTGVQFPAAYRGGLFIGFHGSWNRTDPTGYKLVYVPFVKGAPQPAQDFATGWLKGGRWGRPVAPLTASDGSLLLTDDRAGVVYRISYGQ